MESIEPIPQEGGARTAFEYAQYAADYLPANGMVRYNSSSASLLSNQLHITIPSIPEPASNESLWIYLVNDDGTSRALGSVPHSGTSVDTIFTVASKNLVARYKGIYLT